jgi:WXXGXW repeat (2 copies)
MKILVRSALLAVMLFAGMSALSAAQLSIGVRIGEPPPPRVVRVVPQRPGAEFVWVDGYWYPVGRRYMWHAGYWTRPPYEGARWVGPHHDGAQFFAGYWDGDRGHIEHDHRWDHDHDRDSARGRDDHGHDNRNHDDHGRDNRDH